MPVLMFRPRFRDPILAGTKTQTIRAARKRPIRPLDSLSLRVWQGRPYGSPQLVLGSAVCTFTMPVEIDHRDGLRVTLADVSLDGDRLDAFARADGFADARDMDLHWQANGGYPFRGLVYLWGEFSPAEGEGVPS